MNADPLPDDERYHCDIVVVGAGAAGLTAASVARAEGKSVLLLEQAAVVGGTTAISGGMVWIPANHKMAAAGIEDDLDQVRLYLSRTVSSRLSERLEAFLRHGDEAVRYLEEHTAVRLRPVPVYPDYYPQQPGSVRGARVLEPVPYDAQRLGSRFDLLRDPLPEFTLFGGMMISREDIPHLRRMRRSPRAFLHVAKLITRYAWQRLSARRGTTLYLGNALAGRLLQSALDLGVEIRTGATVERLIGQDGRIDGVIAQIDGKRLRVEARCGVILATGGLSRDAELRRRFTPEAAGDLTATIDRGQAPNGARLAMPLGGQLSEPDEGSAFWVPASEFTRRDGSAGVFPHTVTDRGKPGIIAVGSDGRRFVNEALSYHEFGLAQLRNADTAIPAYLLCDSHFLWTYGLGRIRPFSRSHDADLASGYLKEAGSIEGLAEAIGVPASALANTVCRFNDHARVGEDPDFGRGGDIYQRHLGDGDVQPNPCIAPIETAPFYAVAVRPADLGMSAGLVTDTAGRILDSAGHPISGLYACGNDMQSVMNGAYPGPGITLGPALTFGYLAARHACETGTAR